MFSRDGKKNGMPPPSGKASPKRKIETNKELPALPKKPRTRAQAVAKQDLEYDVNAIITGAGTAYKYSTRADCEFSVGVLTR